MTDSNAPETVPSDDLTSSPETIENRARTIPDGAPHDAQIMAARRNPAGLTISPEHAEKLGKPPSNRFPEHDAYTLMLIVSAQMS